MIRPTGLAALLVFSFGACATSNHAAELTYCTRLHQLYFRYHTVITYAHNGQRAIAELALHDCEQGRYAAGIETLTALLARERVAVPAPPSRGM